VESRLNTTQPDPSTPHCTPAASCGTEDAEITRVYDGVSTASGTEPGVCFLLALEAAIGLRDEVLTYGA
jgi:hypothetical protein